MSIDHLHLVAERAVRERYVEAAQKKETALCCPVEYNKEYLKILPQEILERDYGCGDPSKFVRAGDTVLDLGSGGGKICYIAAQVAGPQGKIIGVDMNDEMLALARKYQDEMAQKIGAPNVEFRKGKIQDLRLDLDEVDEYLRRHPIRTSADLQLLEEYSEALRKNAPLIEDDSIDVVVSNCVLNLVKEEDRRQLFAEIFRVLKIGGRAAISDIVSDEEVPAHLKNDPELWSGCISGAFTESGFLKAFEDVGFYGMQIVKRDDKPWQTVEGIEFRSVTIIAHKGKQGPCYERNQAVIYQGPWKAVIDDDGHTLFRGERMAVCDKTYRLYTRQEGPYAQDLIAVEPYNEILLEEAKSFNCSKNARRHPKETKGQDYKVTEISEGACCGPDGCC
ncbi:methyltransferase domain-containing protein [candidate division KSB1 bacterium]|nr:methyltransferase domain-containing protein [candidate division KSB1 bacterium]